MCFVVLHRHQAHTKKNDYGPRRSIYKYYKYLQNTPRSTVKPVGPTLPLNSEQLILDRNRRLLTSTSSRRDARTALIVSTTAVHDYSARRRIAKKKASIDIAFTSCNVLPEAALPSTTVVPHQVTVTVVQQLVGDSLPTSPPPPRPCRCHYNKAPNLAQTANCCCLCLSFVLRTAGCLSPLIVTPIARIVHCTTRAVMPHVREYQHLLRRVTRTILLLALSASLLILLLCTCVSICGHSI